MPLMADCDIVSTISLQIVKLMVHAFHRTFEMLKLGKQGLAESNVARKSRLIKEAFSLKIGSAQKGKQGLAESNEIKQYLD